MKTLKKIALWILAIIALLVIIAYLLPRNYKVERSIFIKADKMVIYDLTSNFNKWNLWVAWNREMDSTVVFELSGEMGKPGAQWKWNGQILGNGEMTLTELQPGQFVGYDLAFDQGKYTSKGGFNFEESGDSVKITWFDTGDLGFNPIARYMGLMMERMMGPDFEKGLSKLKLVAEERTNWPKIEEIVMQEQIAALIRDSAGPATYTSVMGNGYGEIMSFLQANKLEAKGSPFAIYITWDSITMNASFDLGIAIDKIVPGKGRIRVETLPAQKAVMAAYFGSYENTAATYYILDKYCKEGELECVGGPWEIYITDPMIEKDTSKWETRIVFPIK